MTAESEPLQPTPEQQRRIDALMDGSGYSARDARAMVLEEGDGETSDKVVASPRPAARRPSGHVRDFADGGRADKFRGGVQPVFELSPEQIERNRRGIKAARAAMRNARLAEIDKIDGPNARQAALVAFEKQEAIKDRKRRGE